MYRADADVSKEFGMPRGNKIHFTSLGCARNLVDSEIMLGILLRAGYEATDILKEADYLVVNTCGFLETARRESRETIEAILQQKKPDAKLIVAGCMVQKYGSAIQADFPGVHYFLGSGDMEKILEAVQTREGGIAISSARSYLQDGEVPRRVSTPQHYAYLKIAEGCAKQCAFCIIPKIKGKLRSKSLVQVVKEFRLLRSQGAEEVILIAQDLGDYGKDRRGVGELETLLKELLKEPGDFWLRLLYLYPDEITDELIEIMEADPRVCRYLDMPIQHINDEILRAMRRRTSRAQIIATIEKLRRRIPDIVIRTSLMVGFPGETEAQFEELVEFVRTYPLDNVGIFTFSKEEDAPAAKMQGHLHEDVKTKRYKTLSMAQQNVAAKMNAGHIGKKMIVVVEGYHQETDMLMVGRFYGQCPEIDGQVIINDGRKVGQFGRRYLVEITDAVGYDLVGRVLASVHAPKKRSQPLPMLTVT